MAVASVLPRLPPQFGATMLLMLPQTPFGDRNLGIADASRSDRSTPGTWRLSGPADRIPAARAGPPDRIPPPALGRPPWARAGTHESVPAGRAALAAAITPGEPPSLFAPAPNLAFPLVRRPCVRLRVPPAHVLVR